MDIPVVGIDCATNDAKIGIAGGVWDGGAVHVDHVTLGGPNRPATVTTICDLLQGIRGPGLLALDAPVGWPAPLSSALSQHRAGNVLRTSPNEMFRRETDRFIQKTVGKTPLDVGADRIARTAHAALELLDEVRRQLKRPIPLAWSPGPPTELSAIEVYPAATLIAHRLQSKEYKAPNQLPARREIIDGLKAEIEMLDDVSLLEKSPVVLDAIVCLLAAKDFLDGHAESPLDRELAEQEGWIWVLDPRRS